MKLSQQIEPHPLVVASRAVCTADTDWCPIGGPSLERCVPIPQFSRRPQAACPRLSLPAWSWQPGCTWRCSGGGDRAESGRRAVRSCLHAHRPSGFRPREQLEHGRRNTATVADLRVKKTAASGRRHPPTPAPGRSWCPTTAPWSTKPGPYQLVVCGRCRRGSRSRSRTRATSFNRASSWLPGPLTQRAGRRLAGPARLVWR